MSVDHSAQLIEVAVKPSGLIPRQFLRTDFLELIDRTAKTPVQKTPPNTKSEVNIGGTAAQRSYRKVYSPRKVCKYFSLAE